MQFLTSPWFPAAFLRTLHVVCKSECKSTQTFYSNNTQNENIFLIPSILLKMSLNSENIFFALHEKTYFWLHLCQV